MGRAPHGQPKIGRVTCAFESPPAPAKVSGQHAWEACCAVGVNNAGAILHIRGVGSDNASGPGDPLVLGESTPMPRPRSVPSSSAPIGAWSLRAPLDRLCRFAKVEDVSDDRLHTEALPAAASSSELELLEKRRASSHPATCCPCRRCLRVEPAIAGQRRMEREGLLACCQPHGAEQMNLAPRRWNGVRCIKEGVPTAAASSERSRGQAVCIGGNREVMEWRRTGFESSRRSRASQKTW